MPQIGVAAVVKAVIAVGAATASVVSARSAARKAAGRQTIGAPLQDGFETRSELGAGLGEFRGTERVRIGQLIWVGPIKTIMRRSKGPSSGKGGTSRPTIIEVENRVSFAIAWSFQPFRPAGGSVQTFFQGNLVRDRGAGGVANSPTADRIISRFYPGSFDPTVQLPDPLIASIEDPTGLGTTPAFLGTCYEVFEDVIITSNAIAALGVQSVIDFEGSQPEQIVTTSGGPPDADPSPSTISIDYARGLVYAITSDNVLVQYDQESLEVLAEIAIDAGPGSTGLALLGFDLQGRIATVALNGASHPIGRIIDPVAGQIVSSRDLFGFAAPGSDTDSFVISSELFGFSAVVSTGGNACGVFSLPSFNLLASQNALSFAISSGPGFVGDGTAYVLFMSTTEARLYRIDLLLEPDDLTGVPTPSAQFSLLETFVPTTFNGAATTFDTNSRMAVDGSLGLVLFTVTLTGVANYIVIYDAVLGQIRSQTQVFSTPLTNAGEGSTRIVGGTWAYISIGGGEFIAEIDVNTGKLSDPPLDGSVTGAASGLGSAFAWDDANNAFYQIGDSGRLVRTRLPGKGITPVSAAKVIEDRCARAFIDPFETRVHEDIEGDEVTGHVSEAPFTGTDTLAPLLEIFDIDIRQSAGFLDFVPRGLGPVRTLTRRDFMILDGEEGIGEPYKGPKKEGEVNTSSTFMLNYFNSRNDFQRDVAPFTLPSLPAGPFPVAQSLGTDVINYNGSLDPNLAKRRIVAIGLRRPLEREIMQATLAPENVDLDPGDRLNVPLRDGTQVTVRLEEASPASDHTLLTKMRLESAESIDPEVEADPGGSPQATVQVFATDARLVNVPLLRDQDSQGQSGSVFAAIAFTMRSTFGGASLFRTIDGNNFDPVAAFTVPAVWGVLTEDFPAPGDFVAPDETNTLKVRIAFGVDDINSITEAAWLANGNAALILDESGTCEVICFQNATAVGGNDLELDRHRRGLRGTDTTMEHQAGARIFMLDTDSLRLVRIDLADIGVERMFRMVSAGQALSDALPIRFTPTGEDLRPYAVVNVEVSVVAGDLLIEWDERFRVGGDFPDGSSDGPESDPPKAFEIDVLDGPGGTVLNTYQSAVESFTYDGDDYSDDFGTSVPAGPFDLTLRIYKISAIVGRGKSREVTVTVGGITSFDDLFVALDFPAPFGGHGVRVDGDSTFSDEDLLEILRLFGDL